VSVIRKSISTTHAAFDFNHNQAMSQLGYMLLEDMEPGFEYVVRLTKRTEKLEMASKFSPHDVFVTVWTIEAQKDS